MSRDHIPGRYAMAQIIDDALEKAPENAVWVEVGVALGKGISYMARRLLDRGRHDIKLYAVDPWGGYARNGEQAVMAEQAGGDFNLFLNMMTANAREELGRIHILRADSVAAARVFKDHTLDLVILDADHTFDAVMSDLKAWLPKMKPRTGIIGGDDHEPEFQGVIDACRWYFGKEYEHWKDPLHNWGVWRKRLSENFDAHEGEGGFRGDPTP